MNIQKIIELIPFDKEWDELSIEDKANFCSIHSIGFLSKDNETLVRKLYDNNKLIVEERTKSKLHLYI